MKFKRFAVFFLSFSLLVTSVFASTKELKKKRDSKIDQKTKIEQKLKETKEKTQRPKQKIKTKDNQSKIKIESPSTNNPKTGVGNKISIILTSSLSGLLYALLRKRK